MTTAPPTWALVTGAASGLGLTTTQMLAQRGQAVAMLDRDSDKLELEAKQLEADGAVVLPLPVDLLDSAAVADAVAEVGARGPLQAVVNVAGVAATGTITASTEAEWDTTVGVKLKGTYLVCRAAMPLLAAQPGGAIVNVGSMSGRTKSAFAAPSYSAANGGIIGLTMTVAQQSAALGVRVNCVAPGLFKSPMLYGPYREAVGDKVLESLPAAVPLGRFAEISEIAEVILFLLSDKASYITGETINVNGGMFMV